MCPVTLEIDGIEPLRRQIEWSLESFRHDKVEIVAGQVGLEMTEGERLVRRQLPSVDRDSYGNTQSGPSLQKEPGKARLTPTAAFPCVSILYRLSI